MTRSYLSMLLKMRGDLGQRSLQLVDLLSGVLDDKGHSVLFRFINTTNDQLLSGHLRMRHCAH